MTLVQATFVMSDGLPPMGSKCTSVNDSAAARSSLPAVPASEGQCATDSREVGQSGYAVTTAKSMSMATVTISKNTCSVFGRMPLRSGRKACVPAYIVR